MTCVSFLRLWLTWGYRSSLQHFLASLARGQHFYAKDALEWVQSSNRQAIVRSVSCLTDNTCHNNPVQ